MFYPDLSGLNALPNSGSSLTALDAALEAVEFRETYRDPQQKDGQGKKRLIFSIVLRSPERTLTNEEADEIREQIVSACSQQHAAVLLG